MTDLEQEILCPDCGHKLFRHDDLGCWGPGITEHCACSRDGVWVAKEYARRMARAVVGLTRLNARLRGTNQADDFPLTVHCRKCGRGETIYFNGGEVTKFRCCGEWTWFEATGYTMKTGNPY